MAVAINQRQQQQQNQESDLDKLAKLIQIGATGYGVYDNVQQAPARLAEAKLKENQLAAMERRNSGQANAGDLLDMSKEFDITREAPKDMNGVQTFNYAMGANEQGPQQPVYISPKRDKLLPYTIAKTEAETAEAKSRTSKNYAEAEKYKNEHKNGPKPTESQAKAGIFAKRMESAEGVLNKLFSQGTTGTTLTEQFQGSQYNPAYMKPKSIKLLENSKRNFVSAVLRKESGATISPNEMTEAEKLYFPEAGDDDDVLATKAENRRLAFEGLKAEAGEFFNKIPGAESPLLAGLPKNKFQGVKINVGLPEANAAQAHPQDAQAVQWAKQNPQDPRAAQILKANGVR